MNKKLYIISLAVLALLLFTSCASFAMNTVATSLSGANAKGKAKINKNLDLMLPLTGEEDSILMAEFFPTALKMYEILHAQNPNHQGLALMTASLSVMYANAFIQHPAEMLPQEEYLKQNAEFKRAKMHYLRGRNLALSVFEQRYQGFTNTMLGFDEEKIAEVLEKIQKKDLDAAYWLGASWLGAWSLEPLDTNLLSTLSSAVAVLERAAFLDPNYNDGAIWNILLSFYASAPADFGGDRERAYYAYEKALEVSKGSSPAPYIAYAEGICINLQDVDGFVDALEKALSIDPDENPQMRLQNTIAQEKAAFLLETIDNYFLIW